MPSFSVIVTACNNAAVLPRTLQSVEASLTLLRQSGDSVNDAVGEVVVVNDGSTDATAEVLDHITKAKPFYRILHRPHASSPSCARNTGVAASQGDLLFFLDGDDLFLPRHLLVCLSTLADPHMQFVKTGVHLADPVHPDWKPRIQHSIVLNLCVRRHCHDAIGGFPDYHLFVRDGNAYRHVSDLFYKFEDMHYNQLVTTVFAGVRVVEETVEYVRYPDNSLDRQYEKFCRPFRASPENRSLDERLRLALCEAICEHRLAEAGATFARPVVGRPTRDAELA
jgi:glycosyltransferase involved in cell wall biosynthesis